MYVQSRLLRSVATHGMWIRLKIYIATTLTRIDYWPGESQYFLDQQLCERGYLAQLLFDFMS